MPQYLLEIDALSWQERQLALLQILTEDSINVTSEELLGQARHNRLVLQKWKNMYQQDHYWDTIFERIV